MKPTIGLLLALLSLCAHAEETPNLRIAVVVPLGSNIRDVAQDALNGAKLGAKAGRDRVKVLPGGLSFKVTLNVFDDKARRDSAETVAQTIVNSGQYGAVVGGVNSGTAIPAAEIYEAAGLINVSIGATNPRLTRVGHRWALRMGLDDDLLAFKTYQALAQRFAGAPMLFVDDGTAYGTITTDGFVRAHQALTGQSVKSLDLGLSGEEGDLTGAQSLTGPEAVLYLGGMDLFATKVINRLPQNIHWTLVTADGGCSDDMVKETVKLNIALVCASQERKATVPPSNAAFEKAYTSQFGVPPGPYALAAFDAVALLVETFAQRGTSDSAAVRDRLKSGQPFSGGEGPVAFDAQGDNTLAPAYLYEAKKDRLIFKETLR